MPLDAPILDDASYERLLEEVRARIPVYAPEWTGYNESDPGIALLELFSFLADNLLYRANQIPETSRRRFLALLGVAGAGFVVGVLVCRWRRVDHDDDPSLASSA